MNTLELTPAVFSILSGLIEEKSGLHYNLLDRELLREKASLRALETGFGSLLDYYYFLRYDEGAATELNELVDTLVVNETYFFREWPALTMLVDSFIAPWCAQGRRPRIWSAACASGEEPLSLAMLLQSRGLLAKTEIIASDISARVLAKAKSGLFGKRSVRAVPDQSLCDLYIHPVPEGYRVPSEIVNAIDWRQINLLIPTELAPLGTFDVILCRNVLIYFSDTTVKTVLDSLSKALAPDGALLIGISESLMRYGTSFTGEDRAGAFVYRKTGRA